MLIYKLRKKFYLYNEYKLKSQFQLFVYLCIGRMNIFDIYFCYHLKLLYHRTHMEHLVCIVQFLFTFFI